MINNRTVERLTRWADHNPDATTAMALGRFHVEPTPEHYEQIARILQSDDPDESESERSDPEADEWINDDDFDGSGCAVREHYHRVKPVYDAFAHLNGSPTTVLAGNGGWYKYRHDHDLDIDELEAGHRSHRRQYTVERDFHDLVDGIERDRDDPSWRSFYNITSWKDADAVYAGAYVSADGDFSSGDGLADYDAMRGLPLWVDLDLKDNDRGADGPNYKRRRGDLDDDDRKTVETAIAEYIAEIADLYGVTPDEIAAFDSGGGAYIYGPASATVPIADHYADDDGPFESARGLVFNELRLRLFAYGTGEARNTSADDYGFEGLEPQVNGRVDGAESLLNPDWIQNKNRQSKAPLSIHKNHDIVVTPICRDGAVDYSPTPVSAVDDDLIDRTAREASKIIGTDDPERIESMADSLISGLFPDVDGESWWEILDQWLDQRRKQLRDQDHAHAIAERDRKRRLANRDDLDDETDPSSPEALAGLDVTEIHQDVFDALDSRTIVDVRDVIRDHACDEWDTSDRDHETTFDPSWRPSSSGKSCAVGNGANTFVDSGVTAGGGPAKAYALGTGIIPGGANAAARSLTGEQWGRALDGLRADGYEIPVYIPEAGSTDGSGEQREKTPLWALRKAAVALHVLPPDAFVTRESDDGETYDGFPGAVTFDRTLDELEALGIEHGWDRRGESANTLPTRVEAGLTDEPDDDEERAVRAMIDVLRSTR